MNKGMCCGTTPVQNRRSKKDAYMDFTMKCINDIIVVVRGGGDLATGVVQKFFRAGFKVVVLEIENPLAIRRTVSLCTAVYTKRYKVEEMTACLVNSYFDCEEVWQQGEIPVLIDKDAKVIEDLKPDILIDAIIAKRNLGTYKEMAPITIALGPGFEAGVDIDVVVETKRGHDLGKLYFEGMAIANTREPGELGGISHDRVIYSPGEGYIRHVKDIGHIVTKGETICLLDEHPIISEIDGVVRGLISEGQFIEKGIKCADIDPRSFGDFNCYTISDKARAVGGAALEGALVLLNERSITNDF